MNLGNARRTLILRHPKENLKKCSLRGLEARADMRFLSYPGTSAGTLDGHLVLDMDGPLLSAGDASARLCLVDGTWRRAKSMFEALEAECGPFERRTLPAGINTAYPRYQTDCPDPEQGLASVEALYVAYSVLGWDVTGLLDHYHWREDFLRLNGWDQAL